MERQSNTNTTNPLQCGPPILETAIVATTVYVSGYVYLVDMGQDVRPLLHVVYKDKSCNCRQPDCPAVQVVAEWLKAGRIERAPDPPSGYSPYAPLSCPVCGAGVVVDHSLSSRARGVGWRCVQGGTGHYWEVKWNAVKDWFFRIELIPGVLRRGDLKDGMPMGYLPEANY